MKKIKNISLTLSLCSSRDLSTSALARGPSDTAPSGACGADERASAVACVFCFERAFLFDVVSKKSYSSKMPLLLRELALSSFLPSNHLSFTLSAFVRSSLDLNGGMRAWA